jgi:hypothetical protein
MFQRIVATPVSPASNPVRPTARVWALIPLLAGCFLLWIDYLRVQRVEYATDLVAEALKPDAASPTGYAGGARALIIPEHNNASYHWIVQTQQMFSAREWRVRHVDYDNAPFGRAVESPSPYRWWLGLVAWGDHMVSGRPLGLSVERAALFADPLLHILLLAAGTVFVAWHAGRFAAALFSAAFAALYPFAAWFVPGAPDDGGLALAGVVCSLLPLLAGVRALESVGGATAVRSRRWFFCAGVMGGFGLWFSAASQVPVIVGVALGGLLAVWAEWGRAPELPVEPPATPPWRAWAVGGATTVLAACLIDYFPDYLGTWQLQVIHPLYGLAWLGLGALVAQAAAWGQRGKLSVSWGGIVVSVLAVAAVTALPVVMWKTKNEGFLARSVSSYRLMKLPGGPVDKNLWGWMLRSGITRELWITALPLLLVLPAGWMIFRRSISPRRRAVVAIALGPVLVATGFAGWHLSGWSLLDGAVVVLLVACVGGSEATPGWRTGRWAWSGSLAAVVGLGLAQVLGSGPMDVKGGLSMPELTGLIERDLARWLAKHAGPGGALVLAPPNQTTTLYYYGGLRGLGTPVRENQDGVWAAIRMLSASTPDEAKELIDRRGVTHIVIPSWDPFLDEYARIGMGQLEGTFLSRLHFWRLPPWLRPVPYQLPVVKGFEGQSVAILEVVEDQEDAAALSRLAEYFVEMGQLELADSVGQALRRFPADLGALVARAQVELAHNDAEAFARSVELVRPRLTGGGDRGLLWDRRASLAVVLARGKHADLAREQVRRCLADADESKVRSLSTLSLYRLLVLAKAFDLQISDPRLRDLARELLPDDLRIRLQS